MSRACFAQILNVSTPEDLTRALANVNGATEIVLAAGSYGDLDLNDVATAGLTIRSKDPFQPAEFSGLTLRSSANITLKNLSFQLAEARPAVIGYSTDIAFDTLIFTGSLATEGKPYDIGFPTGLGLMIRDSAGVTVTNSHFSIFQTGLLIQNVDGFSFDTNVIHSIRSDGMDLAQVQNVAISGNTIRDFLRSKDAPDHADMIQFWTTKTTAPSENILIENN
ncbi:MAG: right-handed parallel beta-helix repeat-containing protein, partial [Deltaproteobacteria bacterium]